MPVFRLDNISIQQVEDAFSNILFPLDVVAIIMLAVVFAISKYHRVYDEFPGTLFLWLLPLDAAYSLVVGPLRWTQGSALFETLGNVRTMSNAACRWAAFIDTFFQMGSLYLNTCIVATVFYMVYYASSFHGESAAKARQLAGIGFFAFTIPLSVATVFTEPYRGVGFCICDGIVLVIKQTIWYTMIMCQVAMVVPTQYRVYKSSQASMKSLSRGTYIRFCGIIVTQIIGLFPIMLIEAYGLTRVPVPGGLIYFMAVGFPLGHILDAILMSLKALPALFPLFSRLMFWDSKQKTKQSNPDDYDGKSKAKPLEKKVRQGSNRGDPLTNPMSFIDPAAAVSINSDNNEYNNNSVDLDRQPSPSLTGSSVAPGKFKPPTPRQSPRERERGPTTPRRKPKAPHEANVPLVRLRRHHRTRGQFLGKIVFTLMLPVFGIIGFCIFELSYEVSYLSDARKLALDSNLAPIVTNYAHQVLLEQTTAILAADSQGQDFQLIMETQMKYTDRAQNAFLNFQNTYTGRIQSADMEYLANPTAFNDERQRVANLEVRNSSLMIEYNKVSQALFNVITDMVITSRTGSVTSLLYAFVAALEFKADVGAERNMLPDLFRDRDLDTYITYMGFRTNQEAGLSLFTSFASDEALVWLSDSFGVNSNIVKAYHQSLDAQDFAALNSTTFEQYFTVMGNYIDEIGTLQDNLASEMINFSESTMRTQFGHVMAYTWLLVFTLFITIVMMYVTSSTLRTFSNDIHFLQRQNGTVKDVPDDEEKGLWRLLKDKFKLSFVWQILITLVIPVVCLCTIILVEISNNASNSKETFVIRTALNVCNDIGAATDQLALEAAAFSKFLYTGNNSDYQAYAAQQAFTDSAMSNLLNSASDSFGGTDIGATSQYQALVQTATSLPSVRAQLNATVTADLNQALYQKLKDGIVGTLRLLAATTNADTIEHKMLIALSVAQAKRSGGLTRIDGATAARVGGFTSTAEFSNYIADLAMSRSWTQISTKYASAVDMLYLNVFTDSPTYLAYPVWEGDLASDNTSNIAQVRFTEWFYMRTQGDNLLQDTNDLLTTDVVNFAAGQVILFQGQVAMHSSILVVGSFLSLIMVMRSIFKVKSFSKLMEKHINKEEKRLDGVEITAMDTVPTSKMDNSDRSDEEPSSVLGSSYAGRSNRKPVRRNSTTEMRGTEMVALSKLLLTDFRLDTTPEGHSSHHQAVLQFFTWISTTEGLVTCNKMLFARSQPGEGVQSLEFWNQLSELQCLASQLRAEQASLRRAELGEELYEKAEIIYLTFVKDRLDMQSMPSSPRGASHSKSVIGQLPTRPALPGRLSIATRPSHDSRHGYGPGTPQPRDEDSFGGEPVGGISQWRAKMTSSLQIPNEDSYGKAPLSIQVDASPVQRIQARGASSSSAHVDLSPKHRRFSLTEVLDDPKQLALFKKYCAQIRCMEIYDFLVGVRKFKQLCAGLPLTETDQRQPQAKPEVVIREAEAIFSRFLADTAPRKVNISSAKFHEIGTRFAELPDDISLSHALQLEGVFDTAYNEVRRLMVHNILGNVLASGHGTPLGRD